jgi:hypothetical protein
LFLHAFLFEHLYDTSPADGVLIDSVNFTEVAVVFTGVVVVDNSFVFRADVDALTEGVDLSVVAVGVVVVILVVAVEEVVVVGTVVVEVVVVGVVVVVDVVEVVVVVGLVEESVVIASVLVVVFGVVVTMLSQNIPAKSVPHTQ